ncbi:gibberellin 2-beta-dioxygenase 8 isoform X1 [Lycium barbarum]|uniref:gibberellin 2-beta-dioxygenase 8 isoform X1 n=2 Tax=Lycium barbarum TaxID=112863 RepID=UPI00293E4E48|nr:gibberellin 2-beta-dioxygenase 8 isoform X1 [Lycium barbarum]XP_060194389.1 gibberellin 2-beta-dioxygenase 8 isoform X1 [Lycium barbarum]XP_060194390.1 gibberellin 2-beta-dioxygenase 8 isoform X1 [Lycium barbarum]
MGKSTNFSQQPNQKLSTGESPDPPFEETYKKLFDDIRMGKSSKIKYQNLFVVEECELPLIDLEQLNGIELDREECKRKIAKASQEWGFFQVVNHGISHDILAKMRMEQIKLFKKPFHEKMNDKNLKFSAGSYRWGTPSATCLQQLSWSEAFHVPLTDITNSTDFSSLSSTMEQFATTLSELAHKLARILSEKMGYKSKYFRETCLPSTCYLRMNRYPACPISPEMFGLMPHTDSDFLTILHQDEIGGLQLVRDGKWISVKPNPEALIINIGDLFQAWSNGVYKSVEHRVVTNKAKERFSTAFFLCPSYDTEIRSCFEPSVYRRFTFREFRQQVQEDVKKFGYKVGLPRFLVSTH